MALTTRRLLMFTILLLAPLSLLHAADWPQWGGTHSKNMVSAEKGLPWTFEPADKGIRGEGSLSDPNTNVRWAVRTGDFSCGTPTVAAGKVFIGAMIKRQGVMNCFDESTGKLLWQWIEPCRSDLKEDAMNFRRFPQTLGICSTPVVDGDRFYFVDQNCRVVCLSVNPDPPASADQPGRAHVIWTFDMYTDPHVGSRPSDACNGSPLIDGDMLYVTTSNGVDRIVKVPIEEDAARRCFAPDAPTLIVLDKRTGRFLARDTAPITANMLHGQWSSPSMGTVNGRKLVFLGGGDGNCYAFEALDSVPAEPTTLKTAWWVDCDPKEYRVLGGTDVIKRYTLGDRRRSDTINKINDGSFVGISEIIATPVFYNNRVFVAIGRDPDHGRGRGMLSCLDADQTGDSTQSARIWTYQGLDRTVSTVSISDGLLYIADVGGRVHCLDVNTGEVQWVYASGSRTIASTLVADGKVYLPTERYLHILQAGKQMKLLSRIRLGGRSWTTPVAANHTLYIASQKYLWAVQQRNPVK